MFYTHTHTRTHTHPYKKRWCEDAGRELKQLNHKPKKCWQVPEDARETKDGPFNAWMQKELMWRSQRWLNDKRNSTKEFKGNIQGEENHRWIGKTGTGSWVMNMERQNGVVSRFETAQMTGKSHSWDALHYMLLEVFFKDPFIITDKNTSNK